MWVSLATCVNLMNRDLFETISCCAALSWWFVSLGTEAAFLLFNELCVHVPGVRGDHEQAGHQLLIPYNILKVTRECVISAITNLLLSPHNLQ